MILTSKDLVFNGPPPVVGYLPSLLYFSSKLLKRKWKKNPKQPLEQYFGQITFWLGWVQLHAHKYE